MLKMNKQRKGCKDVFNAFLVEDATYQGMHEFPCIDPTYKIPNRVISFSKAISCKDSDQWVHFYEDDFLFERLWKNPRKYLSILKRYRGVILPDFSLYRDMPLVMQLWNIYRSRAIGTWLQHEGVAVIPNIRFGDARTYKLSCQGISKKSVIAVGTHGSIKNKQDRDILIQGIIEVVSYLEPIAIVIYGTVPEVLSSLAEDKGFQICHFKSEFSNSHEEVR